MSSEKNQYVGVVEAAEKSAISATRVRQLCAAGKVPGARRIGARVWAIPAGWRYVRPPRGRPPVAGRGRS